jgi:hypothetical protein
LAASFQDGGHIRAAISAEARDGQRAGTRLPSRRASRRDEGETDRLKSGFELTGFDLQSSVHGSFLGSSQIRDGGVTDTDLNVLPRLLNEPEVMRQMGLEFSRLDLHVTKLVAIVGHVKVVMVLL